MLSALAECLQPANRHLKPDWGALMAEKGQKSPVPIVAGNVRYSRNLSYRIRKPDIGWVETALSANADAVSTDGHGWASPKTDMHIVLIRRLAR